MHGDEVRGLLHPLLLLLICESPGHGYDLIERLACLGVTGVEPGHVYRVLRGLERDRLVLSSWVTSDVGPARRRYEITSRGRADLEEWFLRLGRLSQVLDTYRSRCARLAGTSMSAPATEVTG